MRTNTAGRALIQAFEGIEDGDPSTVNLDPYLCPAGKWTIGWGHVLLKDGKQLDYRIPQEEASALYPDGITMEQAEKLFDSDLKPRERSVEKLVKVDLNPNQFSALVSFVFNIGAEKFKTSTLLKYVNQEKFDNAAMEFDKWVNYTDYKTGKQVRADGLVRRRRAEKLLFQKPIFKEADPLIDTPTIRAAITGSIGVAVTTATSLNESTGPVKELFTALGLDPRYGVVAVAVIALMVLGGHVVKRAIDRKKGHL